MTHSERWGIAAYLKANRPVVWCHDCGTREAEPDAEVCRPCRVRETRRRNVRNATAAYRSRRKKNGHRMPPPPLSAQRRAAIQREHDRRAAKRGGA